MPTFVDPSHALPILDKNELLELIDGAAGYIVNDYEWSLTLDKTGCTPDEITARCEALVLTLGEQGSEIHHDGEVEEIPVVRAETVVDPTGCGDAYRAGPARRPGARSALAGRRSHGQPDGRLPGRRRRHPEPEARPRRVPSPLPPREFGSEI